MFASWGVGELAGGRSLGSPAGWVRQAQVLLLLDEGISLRGVKARTGMSPRRIGYRKKRWQQQGLEGLLDAPRPGRPKKLMAEVARHSGEEFVRFLDKAVVGRRRRQIHLILDNLSVHKTAAVRAWLECHPHVQLHFTPTDSSWLNQVEIRLGMITRDCLRRGIFRSVPDPVSKIISYVRLYNRNAQRFRWTYRNPQHRTLVSPISVTRH